MVLLLTNEMVEEVLTIEACLESLETLYKELGANEAVTFPRQDLHVPVTGNATDLIAHYLKTMGGASPAFGTVALRLSSDVCAWPLVDGRRRRVKLPVRDGKWLGLVLLFSSATGELLAIMQDGYLSRMRVGATNGLAAKYLARPDARTVGLFGSGWQAGAQLMALAKVRDLSEVKVFSPTPAHRERFAAEMTRVLGIPVHPVSQPEEAARERDIVVTATNTREPFFAASWLEEGMHLSCLQRDEIEEEAYRRCDVLVVNAKQVEANYTSSLLRRREREFGLEVRDHPRALGVDWAGYPTLADLIAGRAVGRTHRSQITCFVNNIGLGAQFAAVGAVVYRAAREKGLGYQLDADLFLENVHP